MEDLINKKSAIDALKAIRYGLWEIDIPSPTVPEYVEHHEQIKNMMEITDGWIKKLEEQPTADVVERKKGKWYKPQGYPRDSYRFICDNCHDVAYFVTGNNGRKNKSDNPKCGYHYCPNCGAYMREGGTK